jgi:hypothetical protein
MFKNIDLLYIFVPAILIATAVLRIVKNRKDKQDLNHFDRAIEHFKATSMAFGSLLMVLWFSLPFTSSLKTFGYPDDFSAIKSEEQILHLLQDYNKAIVRTTEVVHWFIFLFVWWFLITIFDVIKAYKENGDKALAP